MFNLLKFTLKLKSSFKSIIFVLIVTSFFIVLHICMMNDMKKFVEIFSSLLKSPSNHQERKTHLTFSKYILLWQPYYLIDSHEMTWTLKNLNCSVSDCTLTKNRNLLNDISLFDAIIFNEGILNSKPRARPEIRTNLQIYIFTTIESSYHNPSCELTDDNFFNWTLTYKLDSDIVWNYFLVQNSNGSVIAPSSNVVWKTTVEPVKEKIKRILRNKTKAAAWLVSNCNADSLRNEYMAKLQDHLFHFSLRVDIYGACTNVRCDHNDCEEMMRRDYHFYMAFENSLSEDYVTEKVLHGYTNYAVPIVYGGANYTRFLPPGSYINARDMHPYNLAYLIYKSMYDKPFYESFFRWTNLYTIGTFDTKKNHPLCSVCATLHSSKAVRTPAKSHFRFWWNGLNGMKWCLSKEYWSERNTLNIEGRGDFTLY